MTETIKPRQFTITIGNAITSPGASADTFKTQLEAVGSNELTIEKICRNLSFTEPEITTEEVDLMGETAGNQNQVLSLQTPTKSELTGTLLLSPEDDNEFDLLQFKHQAHGCTATSYDKRYNYAADGPTAGFAVVVTINQGSGKPIMHYCLNNAQIETWGGFDVEADGNTFATQDFTITAAASDTWVEFDNDGGS